MTKNVIIGIIVVIVLALGGWYLISQNSITAEPTTDTTQGTDTTGTVADAATAPTGKGTGSLQSVFSRGGNYTCTFETISTAAGTGSKSSGTIYAASGKTRGDFSASAGAGVTTMVHVIRDGSMSYTWIDGQTTGSKSLITTTSPVIPNQPSGAGFTEDQLATVSWDCHPWFPVPAHFVPPTSITFVQS